MKTNKKKKNNKNDFFIEKTKNDKNNFFLEKTKNDFLSTQNFSDLDNSIVKEDFEKDFEKFSEHFKKSFFLFFNISIKLLKNFFCKIFSFIVFLFFLIINFIMKIKKK